MTQDDAHIFCTRDQLNEELTRTLNFVLDLLRDFGLNDFYLELSTRPPGKAIGEDEEWAEAEATLAEVAHKRGTRVRDGPGGGRVLRSQDLGAGEGRDRSHASDVDRPVGLSEPKNFDITYVAPDNTRTRPIMIHRALFGSVERFMAILD
jgi:threonyl-tRNA synthetase